MADLIAEWLNPNNFAVLRDKFNAIKNVLSGGVTNQVLQKSGNGNGEFQWATILDAFPIGYVIANQLSSTPFSNKFIPLNGQTIGSSSSTADLADDLNEEIFIFIYDNISDDNAPVSGGRTGDAASDFASSKKITLPDTRGRSFIDGDDRGSDPSNGIWDIQYQNIGYAGGEKNHILTPSEGPIKNHVHTVGDAFLVAKSGGLLAFPGAGSGASISSNTNSPPSEVNGLGHETRHPFVVSAISVIKYRR